MARKGMSETLYLRKFAFNFLKEYTLSKHKCSGVARNAVCAPTTVFSALVAAMQGFAANENDQTALLKAL
eukprot:2803889-Rhodomonas_salina.1